jgi:CheY-like chemotaxis protein
MTIDATFHKANALIIDSNANARSLLTAQLRELGCGFVRSVARVKEARIVLENAPYDLVLCDYHFEGGDESGQDLLDELRREGLLPYATVFMMITAEATYAKVAEAAEAALDGYLIKPYTLASLAERIRIARHRKRVLGPIFEAIEAQEFDQAANLCLRRFHARSEYWLFAARIGAELLLRLRRYDEAKALYEAIVAAKTLPWAKLGVARADLGKGHHSQARRTLENLIGESPDFADSHDVLGRVHMEQGDIDAALATYRAATELTPGCLMRGQRAGTLAFYKGERGEAQRLLERALINGLRSKLFDLFSITLIALMRYDKRDAKGVRQLMDTLTGELERAPSSARIARLRRVVEALVAMQERRTADALGLARELANDLKRDNSDHECASLVVAVWIRLAASDMQLEEMDDMLLNIGMRFCTTKAATEILVAMCEKNEAAAEALRGCHGKVFDIAETAMKLSMRGQPDHSVELLLREGEKTRNTKLIDMALSVLKRHESKIENAAELEPQIHALQELYVRPQTAAANRPRAVGGLAIRCAGLAAEV